MTRLLKYLPVLTVCAVLAACNSSGSDDPAPTSKIDSVLVLPDEQAVEDAAIITENIDGARITYSQRHGHLMLVQSARTSDLGAGAIPKPLVESHGIRTSELRSALIEYLDRYKDAYHLSDPVNEIMAPYYSNPNAKPALPAPGTSDLTVHMMHTYKDLRIQGRYAQGLFDQRGNLQAVVSRLLPIPEGLSETPAIATDQIDNLVRAAMGEIVTLEPAMYWLDEKMDSAERILELIWLPEGDSAASPLRLVYEVQYRSGLDWADIYVDANNGEIVKVYNLKASDWYDEGTSTVQSAPDEIGNLQNIISTDFNGSRYMGFGASAGSYFRPDQYFDIWNTIILSPPVGNVPPVRNVLPIIIPDTSNWLTDPNYIGSVRSATNLNKNVKTIMEWWQARGWNSWDGMGSSLLGITNVNGSADQITPTLNAWGGGGSISIGDGRSVTSQYFSSSLEVVGHEFMHNVINATSQLAYRNESGALNESLADIFGVALTANNDQLSDPTIGEEVFATLRSVVSPWIYRHPARYSEYKFMTKDSGGVHTNSSIMNKAHSLVMEGGIYRGWIVERQGVAATIDILEKVNRAFIKDPDLSLEEFAALTLAYCELRDIFTRLSGNAGIASLCNAFAMAYGATELASTSIDIDLSLDSIRAEGSAPSIKYILTISNRSQEFALHPQNFRTSPGQFLVNILDPDNFLADPSTGSLVFKQLVRGSIDGDGWLQPGATAEYEVNFGNAFDTSITIRTPKAYNIWLTPRSGWDIRETNNTNNRISYKAGADFIPLALSWRIEGDYAYPSGHHQNLGTHPVGFPADYSGVLLYRTTAYGPLQLFPHPSADMSLAQDVLDRSSESLPVFAIPISEGSGRPPGVILLPNTTPIPGRDDIHEVQFDANGGLPELEGRLQIYLLADAHNASAESDETNNLMCVNCFPEPADPGQPSINRPLIIRFVRGSQPELLFPAAYQDASSRLALSYPRLADIILYYIPLFPYIVIPDLPLPGAHELNDHP